MLATSGCIHTSLINTYRWGRQIFSHNRSSFVQICKNGWECQMKFISWSIEWTSNYVAIEASENDIYRMLSDLRKHLEVFFKFETRKLFCCRLFTNIFDFAFNCTILFIRIKLPFFYVFWVPKHRLFLFILYFTPVLWIQKNQWSFTAICLRSK